MWEVSTPERATVSTARRLKGSRPTFPSRPHRAPRAAAAQEKIPAEPLTVLITVPGSDSRMSLLVGTKSSRSSPSARISPTGFAVGNKLFSPIASPLISLTSLFINNNKY